MSALVAAIAAAGTSSAAGSCIPAVDYRGGSYFFGGTFDRPAVHFGPIVGGGVIPYCDDSMLPTASASPPPPGTPTQVRKVRGVPTRVAVGVPGPRGPRLYLRRGFLLTIQEHPPHEVAYGRMDLSDLTTGRRCAGA